MIPRIVISAPKKSSGKTTLTIGLAAAFAARGLDVRTFKKGADFIDPMWLSMASGHLCHNLDFFMMGQQKIHENFFHYSQGGELALIEGNHGLFDGQDLEGKECTAALANQLQAPVVLVVDCKGASRGIAALVLGHLHFPGGEWIKGVILNNVASLRHAQRLRLAMEHYTPLPILGEIPRSEIMAIEERHLGLQPVVETEELLDRIHLIQESVTRHVDLDRIFTLACTAPPLSVTPKRHKPLPSPPKPIRVAMALDQAIHFYYPENQEALKAAGIQLIPFSLLHDTRLPDADGLYIGGGFPEIFMEALGKNHSLMTQIRQAAEEGMPIYAECGGLMVLAETLRWQEKSVNLIGALPIDLHMEKHPVGYGYMQIEGTHALPWPGPGVKVACHEFHHSRVIRLGDGVRYAFQVNRGFGVDGHSDGLLYRNILACYAHFHADGAQGWADFLAKFWLSKKNSK